MTPKSSNEFFRRFQDADDTWAFLQLGAPWIVRGFADCVTVAVLSHAAWLEVLACAMTPSIGTSPDRSFHWLIYV